ncbi:MAG: Mur ligase family protein [Trueperaceae bacterium]
MTRPESHLEWLFERQRLGMTMGLERVRELLAAVGNPHDSFRSLLVGGTNGKGSTARVLAQCLVAQGGRVGLYTSPHLSRIGERFMVAGREAARGTVSEVVGRVRGQAERQGASFFEVLTAAACLHFEEEGVETAVMEVGLGGRFDATNALDPQLSIITGISLDHTELLGDTSAAIAREKAGILRPGRLSLTAATGDALAVLKEEAAGLTTPLWVLGEEIEAHGEQLAWQGQRVNVSCPAGEVAGRSPLVGHHQQSNIALAIAAALALGVLPAASQRGLAAASWPGRLERVPYRGRWLVFDGAHNAEAAVALGVALNELEKSPYTLIVGAGRDKELPAIAAALAPGAGRVFATRARHSPRARSAREVATLFKEGAEACEDPGEALSAALAATPELGTIVIAGSLYLVGELRPLVVNEEFEADERWQ